MPTTLSPDVAHELRRRLADVCAQIGIDPDNATLIKYTMNAVFLAPPVVLRLARGPHTTALASRVVAIASALEDAAAPTIRLVDTVNSQPVHSDDWVATIWQQVPTIATEPKPVDLAAPLRAIHALNLFEAPLAAWSPVEKFRRRISAAAALPPAAAEELRQWSQADLHLDIKDLLDALRRRCDHLETQLTQVTWHLSSGVIHGDAHTGNVLLPTAPRRPSSTLPAVLCDLDSVCHGPREWDLVPTAHGATRFGRSTTEYRAFVDAYGFDITAWSGWPVLRDLRDLQLVTSTIDSLTGRPDVARELAHRLRTLLAGDTNAVWTRYR
ncbi:aminoglycoside phosphotransferase family protein [Dactylosporangium sp. NBC_01737]|uniref:aminoglycoside phosphotransferase family protein n=1 Tax=Dactylosporangium sp. NBC_01737 TaxID=2975959 RepID=UPI002E0FA2F4|nr:aminoglycoside phosphotransferase family protein [Dactylosporangium sp. NBC_01737]